MVRKWLKELRRSKNFTVKSLAKKLKVSPRVVFAWEAGTKVPNGKNLLSLSRELGPDVIERFQQEATQPVHRLTDEQIAEIERAEAEALRQREIEEADEDDYDDGWSDDPDENAEVEYAGEGQAA